MRVAYTIVLFAYFSVAILRLRLKETLPPNGNSTNPSLLSLLHSYPQAVKESVIVWRKMPKSAFNLFLAIITANGLGC